MPYQTDWENSDRDCPRCGDKMKVRTWESSDGGHEDNKYWCQTCDYEQWVDGIDS